MPWKEIVFRRDSRQIFKIFLTDRNFQTIAALNVTSCHSKPTMSESQMPLDNKQIHPKLSNYLHVFVAVVNQFLILWQFNYKIEVLWLYVKFSIWVAITNLCSNASNGNYLHHKHYTICKLATEIDNLQTMLVLLALSLKHLHYFHVLWRFSLGRESGVDIAYVYILFSACTAPHYLRAFMSRVKRFFGKIRNKLCVNTWTSKTKRCLNSRDNTAQHAILSHSFSLTFSCNAFFFSSCDDEKNYYI